MRPLKRLAWLNCSIATFLLCFAATPLAYASQEKEQALTLYRQKQYRQALTLFLNCAKANPKDTSAYLHAADCYQKLGNKDYAKQTYRYVADSFSGSSDGRLAAQALARLEPVKSESTTINFAEQKQNYDLNGILQIIRPQGDHPPVSTNVEHSVRQALNSLPNNVKQLFAKHGLVVCLTTTLIDKEPALKNRQGRGYDGFTFRTCPGMFNGHEVIICERTIDENDDSVKESLSIPEIINTLYHECGHAVDYYLGDISASEEFKHAYLLDIGKIEPENKVDLAYFLQKSAAGQEECCGELIGILLGKNDRRTNKLRSAFPLTIQLLTKQLAQLKG
ncbi:MAG: hypothetical protein K2W82_13860 [Candidatus Obscuribacterales bacterium]|nr:hypothetical protein [Candidatus Obscuribacterales bacterium]